MKLKITTYKSLLTNKKTVLVVSHNKCGYADYREAQIRCNNGKFSYIITDGYKYLTIEKTGFDNLKSLINIVEHHIKGRPWFARGI